MNDEHLTSRLPLYRHALDWDKLFQEYPLPDTFAETVYQWPRGRLQDLQNERFVKLLAAGWQNPFYRRRWEAAGLTPDDVHDLSDITKLPTFNSDDIKESQYSFPPSGDIQNAALDERARVPLKMHTSGGTTGKARFTLYGPIDWEMNALTVARSLYMQGARPGDILQIPMTCSLANYGWSCYKAAHDYLGVLPLTTGSGIVTPSRRQIELAFDWHTTLWVSFPEYLTQLAKVCREEFNRDIRELGTKFIQTNLGPDTEEILRNKLEALWGCPVYDGYGTHEIGDGAFECQYKNGLHLMEDCVYFEVVDVDTEEPLPPGAIGNLVVTVFWRQILPIIRYNLRDLGRILSEDTCSCGSSFRRMDHFLGRSDDMVKIRGVNIYPMACLSAVQSDERTTGEWFCIADRTETQGVLREELTVLVETRSDVADLTSLREHLERRLHTDLGLKVQVELVEEHSLAEKANLGREGKPKRLLDRRYSSKS